MGLAVEKKNEGLGGSYMLVVLILLVVAALLIVWYISTYNGLVRRRNEVDNAWSQIDVMLKRKVNLIPNLVNIAKGYFKGEQETLIKITEARSAILGASAKGDVAGAARADQELKSQLQALFMMVNEDYPELKSNAQFERCQEELVSAENHVSGARRGYNDAVTIYHNAIETFPGMLVAGSKFGRRQLYELSEESRQAADDLVVQV
jgi:LemA protein